MIPAVHLATWLEWLIKIAAGLTALTVIYRTAVRPAFHFVKRIGDGVEYVQSQMINNGGSTLKDAIDRTEALALDTVEKLGHLAERVEFLEEIRRKQDEVDRIVAENASKLAALRPTLHLPQTQSPKEST